MSENRNLPKMVGKSFSYIDINNRAVVVSSLVLTCPLCYEMLGMSRNELADHVVKCKIGCPLCEYRFSSVNEFAQHLRKPKCSTSEPFIPLYNEDNDPMDTNEVIVDPSVVFEVSPATEPENVDLPARSGKYCHSKDVNGEIAIIKRKMKILEAVSTAVSKGMESTSVTHHDHCYLPKPQTATINQMRLIKNRMKKRLHNKARQKRVKLLRAQTPKVRKVQKVKAPETPKVKAPEAPKELFIECVVKENNIDVLKFWFKDSDIDEDTKEIERICEGSETYQLIRSDVAIEGDDLNAFKAHCFNCSASFPNEDKFDHFPVCDESKKIIICGFCGKFDFQNKTDCISHEDECGTLQTTPTCKFCDKTFNKKHALRRHVYTFHHDLYPFVCEICNKKFKRQGHLEVHNATQHAIGRKLCSICGKDFPTVYKLNCHIRCQHTRERRYQCDTCGQKVFRVEDLSVHRKRIAKGQPCPKHSDKQRTFTRTSAWSRNLYASWKCHECPRIFQVKKLLVAHVKLHINNILNVKCRQCDGLFKNKLAMRRHEINCTGSVHINAEMKIGQLKSHEIGELEKQSFVLVPCPHCEKTYTSKYALNSHLKSHQKQYQCDQCSRVFAIQSHLRRHVLIHDGEHYRCRFCDACFGTERSLGIHQKHHCHNGRDTDMRLEMEEEIEIDPEIAVDSESPIIEIQY